MPTQTDYAQLILLILIAISIPLVIFFAARKIAEWLIGLVLLLAITFYYSSSIVMFLQSHHFSLDRLISFLSSYQKVILDHWPQFHGLVQVNPSYSSTLLPVIILWMGGIIRLIVVRFVPPNKMRDITHEYWLYITSFLIFLLIISNVLNWNILATVLIFLLTLFIVAGGLYRIFTDPFILIFELIRHIGRGLIAILRRIWIYMRYIALIAIDIAKFLYNLLKNIRKLYDKYIRGPFIWMHEKLLELEQTEALNAETELNTITRKLEEKSLDALKAIDPSSFTGILSSSPYRRFFSGKVVMVTLLVLLIIGAATLLFSIASSSNVIVPVNPNATATAKIIAANPYPSYLPGHGTLVFSDPLYNNDRGNHWAANSNSAFGGTCLFTNGTYQASESKANRFFACNNSAGDFSNFTFEVEMRIIKGACGGIIFRDDLTTGKFYSFKVCQNGTYQLRLYMNHSRPLYLTYGSIPIFNQRLNQSNLIAVVANKQNIALYVNHQLIARVTNNSSNIGKLGVFAEADNYSTQVAYSAAKLWML